MAYHRINDEGDSFFPGIPVKFFEQQMRVLAEHFTVCALDELIARIKYDDLPESAVAVTFDDGYRDNYTNAFPILRGYSLPATVFLATEVIGTSRQLWHDQVFTAFRETQVAEAGGLVPGDTILPLTSVARKLETLTEVLKYLWSLDKTARQIAIRQIRKILEVEMNGAGVERLMLSWEEIREMYRGGIQFGAHTVSHPALSRLRVEDAREEILSSKSTIENILNVTVNTFAYPSGRRADFTASTKALVEEVGFDCAVTTIFGNNEAGGDLYEMRRIAPWDEDPKTFGLRLCYYKMLH